MHRLSYEGQEKLFSILDKGEYRPLGVSSQPRSISVRLICATFAKCLPVFHVSSDAGT
ncbi:sigma 54-interacting transcriptional regulator [Salmonella enterica subsp. enterica serovar Virginia]|nr:sigma 54-interacting transcriptional regulator [Salmonella enterica subsp. enterica serovar Virginia]